eukprot:2920527-Lingulodinium_polyedra.AAC.1
MDGWVVFLGKAERGKPDSFTSQAQTGVLEPDARAQMRRAQANALVAHGQKSRDRVCHAHRSGGFMLLLR